MTLPVKIERLRCLSVRQPWAELIIRGEKDVENRSWATKYRGALLVHASGRVDREAMRAHPLETLPTGALVGVVDVVGCTKEVRSEWHIAGMHGWYLERPRRFVKPIPLRGALGLFCLPADALPSVAEALRALSEV